MKQCKLAVCLALRDGVPERGLPVSRPLPAQMPRQQPQSGMWFPSSARVHHTGARQVPLTYVLASRRPQRMQGQSAQ